MASRPRSRKKRGWPDGLYERGGYYSWRNPLTGKEILAAERTYDQFNERSRTHRCVELKQPRWPGQSPCRVWVRKSEGVKP